MNSTSDHELDVVAIKQLTWKPGLVRNLAIGIVERILRHPYKLWPDEISHNDLSLNDRNIVGSTWRLLARAGVIGQTGNYRRSNADGRRSGSVFEYELKSRARAETFLRRNGRTAIATDQPELFGTN